MSQTQCWEYRDEEHRHGPGSQVAYSLEKKKRKVEGGRENCFPQFQAPAFLLVRNWFAGSFLLSIEGKTLGAWGQVRVMLSLLKKRIRNSRTAPGGGDEQQAQWYGASRDGRLCTQDPSSDFPIISSKIYLSYKCVCKCFSLAMPVWLF